MKNVGESAIDAVLEARKSGRFKSIFDFCSRVDSRRLNRRVLESLIQAGAFDSLGYRRAQLMAVAEDALAYGQSLQKERNDPQMTLFGDDPVEIQGAEPKLPDLPEWDTDTLLSFEKEAIGFYVTGHPLDKYKELMEKFANADFLSIKEGMHDDGSAVRIGGIIRKVKPHMTKTKKPMAYFQLEDLTGDIEVTVFPSCYANVSGFLTEGESVFVLGKLEKNEQSIKILAEDIVLMERVEEAWTTSLHIHADANGIDEDVLKRLSEILRRYRGGCKAYLHINIPGTAEAVIALPDELNLRVENTLHMELQEIFGPGSIETRCAPVRLGNMDNNNNGNKNRVNAGKRIYH